MLNLITSKEVKRKVLVNNKNDTIVFLPMTHVAKPEFYKSVKENVDTLRKKGYLIFYEGIGLKSDYNEADKIKYYKKLRKLLGFHLTSYRDSSNQSLNKAYFNKKYVAQSSKNTGIIKGIDYNIDLDVKEVIQEYENKYQEIKLLNCDIKTSLNDKYDCENLSNRSFFVINVAREKHIMEKYKELTPSKLVMIYGKSHWKFIYPDLYKLGFRLVEGKI